MCDGGGSRLINYRLLTIIFFLFFLFSVQGMVSSTGRPIQLADLYSPEFDHAQRQQQQHLPPSIYGHPTSIFKTHAPVVTHDGPGDVEDDPTNFDLLMDELMANDQDYPSLYDSSPSGHHHHHDFQSHYGAHRLDNATLLNATSLFGNSTQGLTQSQKVAAAIGLGIVPSMVALFPLLFLGRRRRRRRRSVVPDYSLDFGQAAQRKSRILTRVLSSLQNGHSRWGDES
jgi:hypothetical protein